MASPRSREQPVDTRDVHSIFEKLGALDATMRDVKHSNNNLAQKVESLGQIVVRTAALQEAMTNHDERINALEADRHRREGAIGLAEWIAKHWPFTILGSLIIAAVMWANGKVG